MVGRDAGRSPLVTRADRDKWDAKHRASDRTAPFAPPPRLVAWDVHLPRGGRALDLACGSGATTVHLARRGFVVDALDVSGEALRIVRERARVLGVDSKIHLMQADLDDPPLRMERAYAVVTVVSFLDRKLLARLPSLLEPHGVLFFETFHVGHLDCAPRFDTAWLLGRGELAKLFPSLSVIEYEEDASRAALLARRS
jgi:SAM-dependent methyltransferase